jgi:PAS domain S-box-containing protein
MEHTPTNVRSKTSRPRLAGTFFIVALVIVLSTIFTYFVGLRVISKQALYSQKQADRRHVRNVLITLLDAESGQRGFLLSGNESYLTHFASAEEKIALELNALEGFDDAEVNTLAQLIAIKLAELQKTLALYREHGLEAAMKVVHTDIGEQTMEDIRAVIADMVTRTDNALDKLQKEVKTATMQRTMVFLACGMVNLGFLLWALRRIREEIEHTRRAQSLYDQQREILGVALTSIGDGVIMTDQQGKVTHMNKTAEELTGWSAAEASGRDCTEVFKIINEDSRQTVESPVEKVLRSGRVVGLANHTLLIRRDGIEVSIDDSGAPIRDTHGEVHGVVLVFRDFTDHRMAEAVLRKAKEEAETANIAKDNFLATLSHELRTPLTPVVATLATWEADGRLSPAMQEDVQMMRRNVELEARLIDDLLDLTRIVKGKLPLHFEVADVHALLTAVTRIYESEIHAKQLKLDLQLEAERHFARVDPARLQQVFWNILKNATKFTPEEGRIGIKTSNVDGALKVIFTDEGIGMTREMLGRLFRPFEQGAEENVRRYGGLGLGMAISKALIEAQHGAIAAQSAGPNCGSSFTVTLPSTDGLPQAKSPEVPEGSDAPRALHILLVEDHADTAFALKRALAQNGHEVVLASSVADAKSLFASGAFELILCDVGLPDGTGLDFIRHVRTSSEVPAVALTGFGMEGDMKDCLDAGFNVHLTKPMNLQRLNKVIQDVAAGKKLPE